MRDETKAVKEGRTITKPKQPQDVALSQLPAKHTDRKAVLKWRNNISLNTSPKHRYNRTSEKMLF